MIPRDILIHNEKNILIPNNKEDCDVRNNQNNYTHNVRSIPIWTKVYRAVAVREGWGGRTEGNCEGPLRVCDTEGNPDTQREEYTHT